MDFAAQAIGILAMCAMIVSYQFKNKTTLLLCQCLGAVFFAINMFMLSAVAGGIMNVVSVIRALVYIKKDSFKGYIKLVTAAFIVIYAASYALTFTVFGVEPTLRNFLLEGLPIIGMSVMTFAFANDNPNAIRFCGFINSPCWLLYHVFNFSIGGLLCEVFSLISVVAALIRLRDKGDNTPTKES